LVIRKKFLLKLGIKKVDAGSGTGGTPGDFRQPYDVFRDRLIFPLKDASGRVIAFSGRALSKDTEPKYLNSPDTPVFTKHEVLYGLDKAKDKIRRKDYVILVEGQIDLVLSHQAGVENAVASSGTAFTQAHLERLKKLSKRIILAFDGDNAGEKAAEKSAELALLLGLEVKIAKLPEGEDPAELIKADPEKWKSILRESLPAIEHFLSRILEEEKDARKRGMAVGKKILSLVALLQSSIEKAHFISLIAKRTGIKEEMIWDDLKKVRLSELSKRSDLKYESPRSDLDAEKVAQSLLTRREQLEERLTEVRLWKKEMPSGAKELQALEKEEKELENRLAQESLKEELANLTVALGLAETSKEETKVEELMHKIQALHKEMRSLEEKGKAL
jgi:DNA primase